MALRDIIIDGQFFTSPRDRILRAIQAEFGNELERLKTAYSIPAPPTSYPTNPSPSMLLFGDEYDEVNRTLVGVEALRLLNNGKYTDFVAAQGPAVRLRYESFEWIREVFQRVVGSADDLYTLITASIINDLGKSATLAEEFQRVARKSDLAPMNHDMLLHQIVSHAPQLIPCLARLPPRSRISLNIKQGIAMGALFNFGQLAQAENVPASFAGLDYVKGDRFAFELRFLEQLLDISGAAGHEDHTGAKKLTESIFQSYKIVYEVSVEYLQGTLDRREAYDASLLRRVDILLDQGWKNGFKLDISILEHRTIMRLLCICNVNTVKKADLVWVTFYSTLSDRTRRCLVHGLNLDGDISEPAVQATYIPSICDSAIRATQHENNFTQKRALAAVFRYLARVLTVDRRDWQDLPGNTVVIERDVRVMALSTVRSSEFIENPELLDAVGLPVCEMAILQSVMRQPGDTENDRVHYYDFYVADHIH